uniref:Uncharacterized protein n=1 Tax=Chenopodium quinoa TaxID=63459 RepID=A0A803KQD8_CHEQI
MKNWVGSKVLLLLIIAIVATMVDSSVAARNEYSEQQEEKQLFLMISNILFKGARGRGVVDDNNLGCWPGGQGCNPFDAGNRCCDGYSCHEFMCKWCPRKGDPCGLLDPCCPGLSCDGSFTGTCH